jgi:hypothetical protein
MTESPFTSGEKPPVVDRAVLVEPTGMDSAVVRQLVWYEGGEHLQTEIRFASLGEALAYASQLCKDESSDESEAQAGLET